jgi:Family of unknown function (DUF6223)
MRTTDTTSLQPILAASGLTAGRFGATVAALIGLIGAVIGGLALARTIRPAADVDDVDAKRRATVATVLGLVAVVAGAGFAITADGGLGTGNGLGGAIVAIALGLVGVVLGVLARARQRAVA